jgi:hypothetical protein
MKVVDSNNTCNPSSSAQSLQSQAEQAADRLDQQAAGMRDLVLQAAEKGLSFDDTERAVWSSVLALGHQSMELFVQLQGDGDLGEEVVTAGEKTLHRSTEPKDAVVRSIFGRHPFLQYTYSSGPNKAIELRPVSARMQLPQHQWSFLLQEYSQLFSVGEAFRQASMNLETVFGRKFSVDILEQTNQRMGQEAGEFLDRLPTPPADQEGELLVASADCKGVPLVKADAARVAAFEAAKKRPGNRRMSTVTSVYSVDPYIRDADQIVEALFRDKQQALPDQGKPKKEKKRPRPQNKHTTAHLPMLEVDGDAEVQISGIHVGLAWLEEQVRTRRKDGQKLILIMDGQESLWDIAALNLGEDQERVEILDIIHVSSYLWKAAALFHEKQEAKETFTRARLQRILQGEVAGVIRGLRRMGTTKKLNNKQLTELTRICGYLEKHKDRMRYDEYLAAGYPVATGVIEGACRHLVKDRMERSGMRWTLEGARNMLHVRATFQSDYWHTFHRQRIAKSTPKIHPHRNLVQHYNAISLAC